MDIGVILSAVVIGLLSGLFGFVKTFFKRIKSMEQKIDRLDSIFSGVDCIKHKKSVIENDK